jgi:hypothetical protein
MIIKNKPFKLISFFCLLIGFNTLTQGQQKSNFSLLLGANINNPHQLIENSNNPNDVIGVYNTQKPVGSIWIGIAYKNSFQISLNNELNNTFFNDANSDISLLLRGYILKSNKKIKPYLETGILIKNYGNVSLIKESLFGYLIGTGLTIKLNRLVNLDLGFNYVYKEYKYNIIARPTDLPVEVNIDRFMIKTGLIFRVL